MEVCDRKLSDDEIKYRDSVMKTYSPCIIVIIDDEEDEDIAWRGYVRDLAGEVGSHFGDTKDEVEQLIYEALEEWIELSIVTGTVIPKISNH